jgi:hypothetical protein
MSMMNQLPTVHVPEPAVRQHRGLIKYRHALIDRRTGIKNTIRSLLGQPGAELAQAFTRLDDRSDQGAFSAKPSAGGV